MAKRTIPPIRAHGAIRYFTNETSTKKCSQSRDLDCTPIVGANLRRLRPSIYEVLITSRGCLVGAPQASSGPQSKRTLATYFPGFGGKFLNMPLPKAAAQSEEDRRQTIEQINEEASHAIEETRTISYDLRPFQLDRLGLTKAIEVLVRSTSRATNINFTTSIANIDDSFPEDLCINFYRIVQEGLNNIMKHSGAIRNIGI